MVHTLTNYNGVQVVAPENDLSADRQALNGNFEFLADNCVRNPMTANLNAGGFDITNIGDSGDNPALAVNSGAVTSLDGGAIASGGNGDLTVFGLAVASLTNHRPAIDSQDIFSLVFGDSAGALAITDQQTTQSYDPLTITNNGSVAPAPVGPFVAATANTTNNLELAANARYTPAQFTLSMWVYYNGSDCNYFGNADAASPQGWELFSQGRLYFQASIAGAWARLDLSATPATGWHHVAVTFDGTTAAMYVDGVLAASQSVSGAVDVSTQPLMAGYSVPLGNNDSANHFANLRLCTAVRDADWIHAEAGLLSLTSLDDGQITTDGLGTLCLHPQSTPPTPVAGGIYFDGAHFNFCANGTSWVALTL